MADFRPALRNPVARLLARTYTDTATRRQSMHLALRNVVARCHTSPMQHGRDRASYRKSWGLHRTLWRIRWRRNVTGRDFFDLEGYHG